MSGSQLSTLNSQPSPHDPIAIALAEDIGAGDLTSRYFVGTKERSARIFAKEPAVAAGLGTGAEVFRRVDPQFAVRVVRGDGSRLEKGDTVLEIRGAVRPILTAERVALNFIQRLSGTATLTRRFVEAVAGTRARGAKRDLVTKLQLGHAHVFEALLRRGGSQFTLTAPPRASLQRHRSG